MANYANEVYARLFGRGVGPTEDDEATLAERPQDVGRGGRDFRPPPYPTGDDPWGVPKDWTKEPYESVPETPAESGDEGTDEPAAGPESAKRRKRRDTEEFVAAVDAAPMLGSN